MIYESNARFWWNKIMQRDQGRRRAKKRTVVKKYGLYRHIARCAPDQAPFLAVERF